MDTLSQTLLRDKLLFSLPYQIDSSQQIAIIKESVKNGTNLDVWYSYSIRGSKSHTDAEIYDNRLNPDYPWEYFDTPLTKLIQELIAPLASFYSPTRIKVFIQKQNLALREHCDKLEYKNNSLFRDFLKTEQFHDFFTEPAHQAQDCLALKIPVSDVAGDNGKGFIYHKGRKYHLHPGNSFYMFNESRLRHGADPCPHFRGVIFLDGLINLKELQKIRLGAVQLTKAENV